MVYNSVDLIHAPEANQAVIAVFDISLDASTALAFCWKRMILARLRLPH
jgi:hypothetical protein